MPRPVRPIALVILTVCMAYPGITMLYQGLYPFVAAEHFNLVGDQGPWMRLALNAGIPVLAVLLVKTAIGSAWILGVMGLWAGDGRAYPLTLLAAVGSLIQPGGAMAMAVLGLICLIFFREKPEEAPAG